MTTLYHGTTTEALDAISAEGLRPFPSTKGAGVWATTSWAAAVHYACTPFGGAPVVVAFALDDDDEAEHRDGRYRLQRAVAPERLTVHLDPRCDCHDPQPKELPQ